MAAKAAPSKSGAADEGEGRLGELRLLPVVKTPSGLSIFRPIAVRIRPWSPVQIALRPSEVRMSAVWRRVDPALWRS